LLSTIAARSYRLLFSSAGTTAIDYGGYLFALALRCVALLRQA
jgi:hypothetical protein|tara:strand:+ start:1545 stop:1673 length:129 start_codon:yes stop_codon:yes gene_type:complete